MQLETSPSQQVIMPLNVKALINQYLKRLTRDHLIFHSVPFEVSSMTTPIDVSSSRQRSASCQFLLLRAVLRAAINCSIFSTSRFKF